MAKIVYRVVTALLAAAVFPIALFVPMFHIVGEVTITDNYIYDDVSLWYIYDLFFSRNSTFDGFGALELSEAVSATMPRLIASGCCLVLSLLLALVIVCFAAFSNKRLVNVFLSLGAIASTIAMIILFNGFATPYTDGTIGVADLGLIASGIINSIIDFFVSIKVLQITSAGFLMIGGFAAVLLWSLSFILTEVGENEKKAK